MPGGVFVGWVCTSEDMNGQLGVQHCEKCKDCIYILRCDYIACALASMCSWTDWSLKEPTFFYNSQAAPIDRFLYL